MFFKGAKHTVFIVAACILCALYSFATQPKQGMALIDSLKKTLPFITDAKQKSTVLSRISHEYSEIDINEGLSYGQLALELSLKISWKAGIADAYTSLGTNYFQKGDYNQALFNHKSALAIYKDLKDKTKIAIATGNIGSVYAEQGKLPRALEYLFQALKILDDANLPGSFNVLNSIASIYLIQNDINKALFYYNKSLEIAEKQHSQDGMARPLYNIGQIYCYRSDYEKALSYLNKSMAIYKKLHSEIGISKCMSALGDVYSNSEDFSKSLYYYIESLKLDEKSHNSKGKAIKLANIGDLYLNLALHPETVTQTNVYASKNIRANISKAIDYYLKAIEKSDSSQISVRANCLLSISKAYSELGNYKLALDSYVNYHNLEDSVFSKENAAKLAKIESKRELDAKEKELKIRNLEILNQKNLNIAFMSVGLAVLVVFLVFMFLYFNKKKLSKALQQKNETISKVNLELESLNMELAVKNEQVNAEREKSEHLLENILPHAIAVRLKEGNQKIADYFEEASIAFADIVNFTKFSSEHSPEFVVETLNEIFTSIDKISEKHNIEKIKTIGDNYMVVSGIPEPRKDHTITVVRWAADVMQFLKDFTAKDGSKLSIKIGIDSGPVVAGIIGEKKFIYDLWGDAVNTAARMEHYGAVNEIQVTERFVNKFHEFQLAENSTDLIPDYFKERGIIDIKGKGKMKVFFLNPNFN